MEAGQWYEAEAQLALLLCAAEQAALREWRWNTAWLLTHLPEPPWHQISHLPPRDAVRPLTRLADQPWVASAVAFAKDLSALAEAEKNQRPAPKTKGKKGKEGEEEEE